MAAAVTHRRATRAVSLACLLMGACGGSPVATGPGAGGSGTAFTSASYAYRLDAASSVQAAVQAGAGPR